MIKILLLSGLLFTAGATPSIFVAKSELWIPWSEEEQGKLPKPPYAARYECDSKHLTYIAADHVYEAPNPVFSIIRREMKSLQAEVVIIEGVINQLGMSPAEIINALPRIGREFQQGGEYLYSAYLARTYEIPLIGAEPSLSEIMEIVRRSPYSEKDILYYYVVRQIGQWKREKADENRTFDELFAQLIESSTIDEDILDKRF